MPGYGQFCAVAQALDLVGERGTLLIVRELLCDNYRFNELLNGLPLISRSLLSQRLKRLEDAALVERHERQDRDRRGVEYRLTQAGRELESIVMGLANWARRWVRHPLSIDRPEVELCLTNPGLDVALTVETKLRTMVEVWLGDRDVNEAVRAGAIELTGQPKLTRVFPSWLLLSSFAEVPRGG